MSDPLQPATIRAMAIRMARELDVSVDRAEQALRNLIARGLVEAVEPLWVESRLSDVLLPDEMIAPGWPEIKPVKATELTLTAGDRITIDGVEYGVVFGGTYEHIRLRRGVSSEPRARLL